VDGFDSLLIEIARLRLQVVRLSLHVISMGGP
jgi:hypothetical protein